MNAQCRCVTIAVSVVAWSGVLLVVTYWSHPLVVFGQYSWGQVTLLGVLVYAAVMAEHVANDIVSYSTKKSSPIKVTLQREWGLSRVKSKATEIKAFVMGVARTLWKVSPT